MYHIIYYSCQYLSKTNTYRGAHYQTVAYLEWNWFLTRIQFQQRFQLKFYVFPHHRGLDYGLLKLPFPSVQYSTEVSEWKPIDRAPPVTRGVLWWLIHKIESGFLHGNISAGLVTIFALTHLVITSHCIFSELTSFQNNCLILVGIQQFTKIAITMLFVR